MSRIIETVHWKQTTKEDMKCKKCHDPLAKEEGYIGIITERGGYYNTRGYENYCMKCFKEAVNTKIPTQEFAKERYKSLTKKRVLSSLRKCKGRF